MIILLISILMFLAFMLLMIKQGLVRIEFNFCSRSDQEDIKNDPVVNLGTEASGDAEVPDKAIRNRYPRKPTPMDYYQLFEAHPIGRDVMDDLVNIFGGATYVRGGHDADRETCFKAGKKFVVDHILIQISKATETKQDKSEVTIDDN